MSLIGSSAMIILFDAFKYLIMATTKILILIKLKIDELPEHIWTFLKVMKGAKSKTKLARNV